MYPFTGRPERLLLIPLFLVSLHISSANANDVEKTIIPGEPVSGTVAGKGADVYEIAIGDGSHLVIKLDGNALPIPELVASDKGDVAVSLAGIERAAGPVSGPTKVTFYTPTGEYAGKLSCPVSCNVKLPVSAKGVWTLVVSKRDQDEAAGRYTLSVNEQG